MLGKASTIRERVYDQIKDDICNGVLAPGQRLQEQELVKRYHVSRSPIRECLRQLAADGLIETIPNRGAVVHVFDQRDVEEIYDLRVMLEYYAVTHLSKAVIDSIREALLELLECMERTNAEQDFQGYVECDRKLHGLVVEHCSNKRVVGLYHGVECQIRQFRQYSLTSRDRWEASLDEHRQIICQLLEGDFEAAAEKNLSHLLLAKEQIVQFMSGS